MPYLLLLERLLRAVPGSQATLLLDALGELVVDAGARDERNRLIGAYQGISLAAARRTTDRYAGGRVECIVCRYTGGTVIVRSLKDGYYLVLSLSVEASLAQAMRHSAVAQEGLEAEL